ncbi:MAG: MBL fold metallo-hydrolase, partial [Candidatus Woesearchaeota archaeon]
MIEIQAIGGYSEIGKNMTLIKYKQESVILDMGIHLENYIKYMGDNEIDDFQKEKKVSYYDLMKAKAIPDDSKIDRKNVLAIIPSHAHLDHIGAIPFMANRYDCPILCSQYTASVIKAILNDKKSQIRNEIIALELNRAYKLSDSISVELISITHSIPNATIVIIHTPDGKIAYTNDFKFDDSPTFGKPTNYDLLKNIKPKVLFLDSLYADKDRKTPSEKNAEIMLKELLLNLDAKNNTIIVTTFSSHIARLKTIIEIGEKLNRKVVLLGRSLAKYVYAAENIGIINFSSKAKIISYKSQISRFLKKINEEKEKYLIIATGHQGEKDAV